MTGFAKGEFKIQIQGDAHFGDARLAYVGIKGDFGRIAIGKQNATQFAIIAGPVDIFNRASTPLAYDDASPFRTQEMVTYRKHLGNLEFRVDSQFAGDNTMDNASDFYNTGLNYQGDDFTAAVAFYNKDLENGGKEETLGVSASKNFGDWYVAAAYQDREVNNIGGSTIDVVAAYAINDRYTVKVGLSQFDDGLSSAESFDVERFNTTLEWQGSPDFRLFAEYQHNNFEYRDEKDSDQLIVGMRYNFDYKF